MVSIAMHADSGVPWCCARITCLAEAADLFDLLLQMSRAVADSHLPSSSFHLLPFFSFCHLCSTGWALCAASPTHQQACLACFTFSTGPQRSLHHDDVCRLLDMHKLLLQAAFSSPFFFLFSNATMEGVPLKIEAAKGATSCRSLRQHLERVPAELTSLRPLAALGAYHRAAKTCLWGTSICTGYDSTQQGRRGA